jgi:hypothetical protein
MGLFFGLDSSGGKAREGGGAFMKPAKVAECRRGQPISTATLLRLRLLLLLVALGLAPACATSGSPVPASSEILEKVLREPGSRTVVVLPFENCTDEPGVEDLVRESFYSHVSPKKYHDFELERVDRLLESLESGTAREWRTLSSAELGEFFRADLLIYGKVLNFRKTFLGIYSQISLTVAVDMVACESGERVWQKTLTRRSHKGGLPFSLFGVIPAALISGGHMTHEHTVALVDRIARDLAAEIPQPPAAAVALHYVELQVASFLERERAETALARFSAQNMRARIERAAVDGNVYHRVLLGPFHVSAEAEEVRDRIARETEFQPIMVHHDSGDTERDGGESP